jgi:hypothetical protein
VRQELSVGVFISGSATKIRTRFGLGFLIQSGPVLWTRFGLTDQSASAYSICHSCLRIFAPNPSGRRSGSGWNPMSLANRIRLSSRNCPVNQQCFVPTR